MAFGQPTKAKCEKKVSHQCLSRNGEVTLIYNKARMACFYCNEEIKKGVKTARKEQAKEIRQSFEEMFQGFVEKPAVKKRLAEKDVEFYKRMWDKNKNWKGGCLCEECDKYLSAYSAVYVSHIISKGAETRLRYDDRNVNILCHEHHSQWETGNRETMRIFEKNQQTIALLKQSLHDPESVNSDSFEQSDRRIEPID